VDCVFHKILQKWHEYDDPNLDTDELHHFPVCTGDRLQFRLFFDKNFSNTPILEMFLNT
jgi:hypothetical protein